VTLPRTFRPTTAIASPRQNSGQIITLPNNPEIAARLHQRTDGVLPALVRVLVVDDDAIDRESVRRALRESGLSFELVEAADEHAARAALSKNEVDCVLLDYRFPGGDAFALFADMFSRPCDSRPPIVVLTGVGDETIAAGAIKRGAQDYVRKSEITPAGLRRALEGAIEVARLERRLKEQNDLLHRLSLYDNLTGLPNRNLFFSHLELKLKECERRAESFALLMMDLDGFKEVNDSLGHDAGDQLLRAVAQRLASTIRESDTIARLGGDEFAGMLSISGATDDLVAIAEKLCHALDAPITLGGESVHVGLSMGVALYPRDGQESSVLLRRADAAMYRAKRSHKSYAIRGRDESEVPALVYRLRRELQSGPDLDQFEVHYQPQIDLATREVVSVEALVRWRHPELGLLAPEQFLPTFARQPGMRALTLHVIDRAARQVRQWQRENIGARLAVNLAPALLTDKTLPEAILGSLARHGMKPGDLTIELAESAMMIAPGHVVPILECLRAENIQISIDDFGANHSSLTLLQELPVDELKIDRMFVHRIETDSRTAAIARAIVELGRGLGARVVAEGIESAAGCEHLGAMGCRFGQGFLFSAPLEADAYPCWHRHWCLPR
jgi:diguanylate cyclase (GGDEF)-like protein